MPPDIYAFCYIVTCYLYLLLYCHMLVICLYDLRQPDVSVVVTGGRILLRDRQADRVLRAVMDTRHAHLTVFRRVDRPLIV